MGGAAKMGAPLSPVLAPYNINLMDFCRQFNDQTEFIKELQVTLSCEISLYKDKSFSFRIKPFSISFLVYLLRDSTNSSYELIYKIALIRLVQQKQVFNRGVLVREVQQILHSLKSWNEVSINSEKL